MKRYLVRRTFDAVPVDGHGLDGVVELVDLSGGASNVTVGQSVADLTALAAITKGDTRPDRQTRFVESEDASYSYDEQASAGDVQPDDSDGTGTGYGNGWWSKFTVSVAGAETLIQTTDDLEAILEAATDGSSFRLADGTHTITGLITITSKRNISIRGSRAAIVTRSSSDIFQIEGCHDFTMEGFTLSVLGGDWNVMVTAKKAASGSYLLPTRHHYRNLFFETTNVDEAAVDAFNVPDDFLASSIEDCHFNGRFYNVLLLSTEVVTEYISGSSFARNKIVVAYSDGGTCVTVAGNGNGFQVTDNYIEGPFDTGVRANADYVEISSNLVTGTLDDGILISSAGSHARVIDNVVYDAGEDGIDVSGDHAIVSGNQVFSSTNNGIKLTGVVQAIVSDNLLELNGGYGIVLGSVSSNNVIDSNKFDGNTSGTVSISADSLDNEVDGKVENTLQTTGATTPTISTIAIPDDTAVLIEVSVNAFRTNGADQVAYKKAALVYRRSAGIAVLEAVQDLMTDIESDAGFDATIGVDGGNNAIVTVTGVAVKTMEWKSRHTVQEVS